MGPSLRTHHLADELRACIHRCSDCHDACAAAIIHCLTVRGDHAAADHIRALLYCAHACDLARETILRGWDIHHETSRVCAEACEQCAASCEPIAGDDVLKDCAAMCRLCAEACRATAEAGRRSASS